jgi:hypothetical protein
VRTTLTLDEDVAARLRAEARRSGKPFREVVNEHLRVALSSRRKEPGGQPTFAIHPRDLGGLRPGLSLDHVGELLEIAEGPTHR